jgi:hypothetical protein
MIIWNFFILGFIFIAIFFKPNWLIMAIVGFMVTIGLNLGTYHKYHREIRIPKKLLRFIIISNIPTLPLFLGSNIWLDRTWIISYLFLRISSAVM